MMMGVAQVIGMNPTLRSFFSSAPPCANTSVAVLSGKNWLSAASAVEAPTDLRKARRAASCGKHRAHHRRGDHALVALLLALDLDALQRRGGVAVVLDLADVASARAARAIEPAPRVEGIVEN